jgi:dethiobiotin synthetase
MMTRGLFITGTDTGVGKTHVAAMICREARVAGVRVGAYKPACSGSVGAGGGPTWEDVERLFDALGGEFDRGRICPQRFAAPLAPHVAARLEGGRVDEALLRSGAAWWSGRVDLLVVEGAGGLLSPISERDSVADVARDLGFPLIVVARLGLGTINHTLLTLEAAASRGLTVAGIVFSQATPEPAGAAEATNPAEVAARTGVPVRGVVPFGADGLRAGMKAVAIDWVSLAGLSPECSPGRGGGR